jgi:hypothetical protein
MNLVLRHARWILLPLLLLGLAVASPADENEAASRESSQEPAPRAGEYSLLWQSTAKTTRSSPDGEVEMRSFYRLLRLPAIDVPVASVSYFKLPIRASLAPETYDPEHVGELLRKAYALPSWQASRRGAAYVYTADWDAVNKIVRIMLLNTGKSFIVSVALIRKGYSDEAIQDTEMLQRGVLGIDKGAASWVDGLFCFLEKISMGSSDAWAEPPAGIPAPGTPAAMEEPENQSFLTGVVSQATAPLMDSTTRDGLVDQANSSLSPVLSGFIGAFFGTVAVDGLSVLAKFALGALIKPQMSDQELLKAFQDAKSEYEQRYKQVAELEKFLPAALRVVKAIEAAGGRDKLIKRYRRYIADATARKTRVTQRLSQLADTARNAGERCRLNHQLQQSQVILDIIPLNEKILESLPPGDVFAKKKDSKADPVCRNFVDRIKDLIDAEQALETLRVSLIANQRGYASMLASRYQNARKQAEGIAGNRERDMKRDLADVKLSNCVQPIQELYADRRLPAILNACIAREEEAHGFWSNFPIYSHFYVKNTLTPRCRAAMGDAHNPLPPDLAAKKQAIDKNCDDQVKSTQAYYDQLDRIAKNGSLDPRLQDLNGAVADFHSWVLDVAKQQEAARTDKTVETLQRELAEAKKAECALEDDK